MKIFNKGIGLLIVFMLTGFAAYAESPREYSIREIEIKDQSGAFVNSLQRGTILSAVTIAKSAEQTAPAIVYAAVYDNGKLTNIKAAAVNETQGTNTKVKYTFNMPLENIDENSSVKLMIWNGTDLRPYSLHMDMLYGYKTEVSAVINQLYTIPVTASSGAKTFKIKFDNEFFVIDDLCRDAADKITQTGAASDTIRIDEITQDSVTFTFLQDTDAECINRMVFKAVKTGNTRLIIEEVRE